ncbi:MAG: hypothetical protein JO216_08050 [Hyphomicrobiales bacterium]|nr:hypothetical protein [Hyphomicrobiales bacterium]
MGAKTTSSKSMTRKKPAEEMRVDETDVIEAQMRDGRATGKKRPSFKVRHEPPTLEDAIYAAQGLTQVLDQQIEFAADLMDMTTDELRPHLLKAVSKPSASNRVFVPARSGMQRAVVIETTGRPRSRRVSSDSATIR